MDPVQHLARPLYLLHAVYHHLERKELAQLVCNVERRVVEHIPLTYQHNHFIHIHTSIQSWYCCIYKPIRLNSTVESRWRRWYVSIPFAIATSSRWIWSKTGKLNTVRIYPVELAAEWKLGRDCRRVNTHRPTQLNPTRHVLFSIFLQNPSALLTGSRRELVANSVNTAGRRRDSTRQLSCVGVKIRWPPSKTLSAPRNDYQSIDYQYVFLTWPK